jgi:hypothetical protein
MPVSDLALALAYPAILSASALYAGCSALCRRRRARRNKPAPGVHPVFVKRQSVIQEAKERAFRDRMIAGHAELIVAAEFERVAHLYDAPLQAPVDVAVREATRVNALFRP